MRRCIHHSINTLLTGSQSPSRWQEGHRTFGLTKSFDVSLTTIQNTDLKVDTKKMPVCTHAIILKALPSAACLTHTQIFQSGNIVTVKLSYSLQLWLYCQVFCRWKQDFWQKYCVCVQMCTVLWCLVSVKKNTKKYCFHSLRFVLLYWQSATEKWISWLTSKKPRNRNRVLWMSILWD